MTREEAIAVLAESKRQNEVMRDNPSTFWVSHQMADGVKNAERRIAALDMAIDALDPPNEPLTLEQLREMKDKPAYLKVFDPLLESGWHIIKAVTEDKIIFRGWQTVYVPIDGMGVDYNLYRHPPEGDEDT